MIYVITLPRGVSVADAARSNRWALTAFGDMEPTRIALDHWLTVWYRQAVVGAHQLPFKVPMEGDVPAMINHAQSRLLIMSEQARNPGGDFIEELPTRVNIARTRDDRGDVGFAHIDIPNTPLFERVLALFFADYLGSPEQYLLTELTVPRPLSLRPSMR